jgi:methionyl-tRNA synthetase
VTATPPTPNGDLHLGHLSGPYLRADVFTRALRMRGEEVYYLTGIDDHQSYVALKGERIGLGAAETADHFGAMMRGSWEAARIRPDWIGMPRGSPRHVELARAMLRTLHARGTLVLRDAPALFCEGCSAFVFEAYVAGACPHCGSASGGNACEVCGRPNDCADLGAPRCNRCGGTPVVRPYPRLYLPLAHFEAPLREYWRRASMGPHLASLCERMLAGGLPDVAVTHVAEWGIPADVPGVEGQRIYVWFEMAAGYLAAAADMAEACGVEGGWEAFWASPETEVVQFFGFDNGWFHAVLFPALFLAFNDGIRPPAAFVCNEFYRLEGEKFSTSRGHAIWGTEFLAKVPADVVRFFLAADGPETEQTSFGAAAFERAAGEELAGRWQGWLAALGEKVQRECGGVAPEARRRTHEQCVFAAWLGRCACEVAAAYARGTFSPAAAARSLSALVAEARRFAAGEEHWRGLPGRVDERRTAIALELAAAGALAVLAAPLMPDTAAALWRDLGYSAPVERQGFDSVPALVPPGQRVSLGTYFQPLPGLWG